MKEKSIWLDNIEMPKFNKLTENIKTKVLVIGGGISGVLCAYELKKRNIECVLVEAERIGKGITKNTTAFITAQHELLYQDIIKDLGIDKAKVYLELNLKAVERYKDLGKKYDIDFKEVPSVLYSKTSKEKILKEKEALDSLGYKTELIDKLPIDIEIEKGIKFLNQGIIHPLKLIKELSKELNIYEDTMIVKLKGNVACTKENSITFNKVIITTHYPFVNSTGMYYMKMSQRRSYVVCGKHKNIDGTYCSIDNNGLYFRSYKDYLIIGGNDRDTKEKCLNIFSEEIKKDFPYFEIEYKWSNQDCVTIDEVPYIGKYDIFHKNWYVATGYNLWGFTWSMVASFVIADMIEGREGYRLVDPNRCFIHKQLFTNLSTTLKNLLNFKTPRCSHLGCALKWNRVEKTWECPCHGSRYDSKGNLIDGPAMKNINVD